MESHLVIHKHRDQTLIFNRSSLNTPAVNNPLYHIVFNQGFNSTPFENTKQSL